MRFARFALVRNPEEAKRDRSKREDIVKETEKRLEELKQLEGEPHKKGACELRSHSVYERDSNRKAALGQGEDKQDFRIWNFWGWSLRNHS